MWGYQRYSLPRLRLTAHLQPLHRPQLVHQMILKIISLKALCVSTASTTFPVRVQCYIRSLFIDSSTLCPLICICHCVHMCSISRVEPCDKCFELSTFWRFTHKVLLSFSMYIFYIAVTVCYHCIDIVAGAWGNGRMSRRNVSRHATSQCCCYMRNNHLLRTAYNLISNNMK